MGKPRTSDRKPSSGTSLRTRRGKGSAFFAGVVIASLLVGAGYLGVTDQWGAVTQGAALQYQEWFEGIVNDPDNDRFRAALLNHVIAHYRETPTGKSLPLRNDAGKIVGRFLIVRAEVDQPFADSDDPAKRRIYTVELDGLGELYHERGGRVRFEGSALVTYQVDFRVDDWTAYAHFSCLEIERARFECLHIDNILGQIFRAAVRNAGTRALEEAIRPGFTVIARANGDTWVAFGLVGRGFRPRPGPYETLDADCELITNDHSLLVAGHRDYLGPIELHPGQELRLTIETESRDPGKSFGVDVYLLNEEQFKLYEQHYPRNLEELEGIEAIEERINVQQLNLTTTEVSGNLYVLVDYTGFGSGRNPRNRASAGVVRYHLRVKR